MNLSALFPRLLCEPTKGAYSEECAAVLGALFVRAYFERGAARRMGWRGILPSSAAVPAWSCRVAGSEHTFGILFEGEDALCPALDTAKQPACKSTVAFSPRRPERTTETAGFSQGVDSTQTSACTGIRGRFSLFVFPDAESSLLDSLSLRALAVSLRADYRLFMRNFAKDENVQDAMAFYAGTLNLELALDGSGLGFVLEAPLRRRIVSLDGVFTADGQCVIPSGALEVDYPAFRLLLPLLGVLAKTLEGIFLENCSYFSGHLPCSAEGFNKLGQLVHLPQQSAVLERMRVGIGQPVAGGTALARPLRLLPLEAERNRRVVKQNRPVLHVLTGFLGSGKTTLLKEWLNFLHDKNRFTGVMQNEFGKVGLDALLLKGDAVVEELDEGCVCCSLADSLRPGLERLLAQLPTRECILETTGLANPEYVLEALEELTDLAVPGLIVTVVDALELSPALKASLQSNQDKQAGQTGQTGQSKQDKQAAQTVQSGQLELLEFTGIRKAQIASADVLILNKIDAVEAHQLVAIAASLGNLNAKAEIMFAEWGRIPFARLDAIYEERELLKALATQAPQRKFLNAENMAGNGLMGNMAGQGQTGNDLAKRALVGKALVIDEQCKYGVEPTSRASFTLLPLEKIMPWQASQRHEHTHVQEGYTSHLLEFAGAVAMGELMQVLNKFMPTMCRIKGLVDISGKGLTTVQYAAGQLLLEPYLHTPKQCGYLVLIGNKNAMNT